MNTNSTVAHRLLRLSSCLGWFFLLAPSTWAADVSPEPLVINLATILPPKTGQYLVLQQLEEDWRKASAGAVTLRRSPGGQKDGEATIVRKLRSGNYQAALLSAVGLSEIEPDAAVLQEMPLQFRDWKEVDFVRGKIAPRLNESLHRKGFTVLFWADSGWVNFFTKKPATTPTEFKRLKIFTWSGDERQLGLMKSLGYHPVGLETSDLLSGFTSGMIDAAPLAAPFAQGMQIPTIAPFVLEVNWVPIVGAAIVKNETWERIPTELQKKFLALSDVAGEKIRLEGRRFHEDALNVLRKGPGSQVRKPTTAEERQWQELAQALRPKIKGTIVPGPIFDEVEALLRSYRANEVSSQP